MWYIVILSIAAYLIYQFFNNRNDQLAKNQKKGGLRKCYPILFDAFLNDEGSVIASEKPEQIIILWRSDKTSARFTFTQLLNNNLRISYVVTSIIHPPIKNNWEFPSYTDQETMALTVMNDINNKQQHYTHFDNKFINDLIEEMDANDEFD